MTDELVEIATKIQQNRYPDADVIFLAGFVIRSESIATSDLDLVVIFQQLAPTQWRKKT
ncbi:MAG: hypothetical protein AAF572_16970 [Cyanobacteria bacterium P01_B01_bin.77]